VHEVPGALGDEKPIDLRLPRHELPAVEQRRSQPGVPHE
jgi:predicted DNA binding CopG/RHH family protein